MNKITKIEIQKKDKERVNIHVDDKFFMAIYAELIYKFNIKKGDLIDKNYLKKILDDEMYIKAKNKSFNILSKNDQSEKILRDKLSVDFDENIIEKVIDFLKENNLIDDESLAKKIVNTNVNLNRYGKNKIKQNLYKKGISSDVINESMSDLNEDIEFENALYLAKKRYEKIKNQDKNKIHQKLYQHLAYKGFDFNTIKRVLKEVIVDYNEYD